MDPVENRGRSKFFKCFKPVCDDDDEPGCDMGSPPLSDSEGSVRRKKRLRRSFSKVMKAVFFKTYLGKKLESKKSRQESFRSNSSSSSKNEKFVNSTKKNLCYKEFSKPEEIFRTNSNNSSIFSTSVADSSRSSSRASSISSHSRSGSERAKLSASMDSNLNTIIMQQTMKKEGENCTVKCNYDGMCILLVCLVALVFWGKVFAIATCTSAWLFFAPGRRNQSLRIVESQVNNMVDSEEYKKRVIMEGLLERNRPRVL